MKKMSIVIFIILTSTAAFIFLYTTIPTTRNLVRKTIAARLSEYRKGTEYHQKQSGYLQKFAVKEIYDAYLPDQYWAEVIETWVNKESGEKTEDKDLWFVYNDSNEAFSLADLDASTTILNAQKESFVLKTERVYDLDTFDIYRSDEGRPNWVLTAYPQNNASRLHLRFREKNTLWNSGDDYINPIFDTYCEELQKTNNVDLPYVRMVGISFSGNHKNTFYFEEPIPVQCEVVTVGGHPPIPDFQTPAGTLLEYRHPFFEINWPTQVKVVLDVDRYRIGSKNDWADGSDFMTIYHGDKQINIKR